MTEGHLLYYSTWADPYYPLLAYFYGLRAHMNKWRLIYHNKIIEENFFDQILKITRYKRTENAQKKE